MSKLAELLAPRCCSSRLWWRLLLLLLLLRLLLLRLLLRHRGWGWRRPPGALGPAWTPLPPGLLVGGARQNRPEPGTILTDGLLVSEHLREPGPKYKAGPLSFRNRSVREPYGPLDHGGQCHMPAGRNGYRLA